MRDDLLMAVVLFREGSPGDVYVIPSIQWHTPDGALKDRDYEGKKSAPEWGLELSAKQIPTLSEYAFRNAAIHL